MCRLGGWGWGGSPGLGCSTNEGREPNMVGRQNSRSSWGKSDKVGKARPHIKGPHKGWQQESGAWGDMGL